MYPTAAVAAGSAGALAFTGVNYVWIVVAGVTLLALGGALMRLAPRRTR